jgi:hypothetical protein
MNLGEFKQYIESFEPDTSFQYGISKPFSWRGIYSEVAFAVSETSMTRKEILENINIAYTGVFEGYKGGKNRYKDYTDIHFEENISQWTDGGYCAKWIAKIEGSEIIRSQEEKLIKLMFPNH